PVKFGASSTQLTLGSSYHKWDVVYSNTSAINTSDERQKSNIKPLQNSAKFINYLTPVSYTLKNGTSGRIHNGMIAQDVEKVLEQLGITGKDFAGFIKTPIITEVIDGEKITREAQKGETPTDFLYGLRYEEFIAPVIATVQEQQRHIATLQDRMDKAEQLIAAMQAQNQHSFTATL
ncbi:MAG: tail fiber domain-containing protein, partial [Hydrogenoanaerobacterium sp.]